MATVVDTHLRPLTYEDLKQMPQDGNRYELIDGEPVLSPAPSLIHAEAVVRLLVIIRAFVLRHRPGGRVYTAPVDVRLVPPRIVEPDIVYVSPERRHILADPALIEGAPDLVVEVISPSNRLYDEQVKYRIYAEAGVREYWLADPALRTLTIFSLENGAYVPLPVDNDIARSRLLPGLEVDVVALFADLF
jgi:Uma2 family endonuclease